MEIKETLDARGVLCPMPILKTAKKMKELYGGEILEILADDEGAIEDFPAWCDQTGNEFIKYEEKDGYYAFYIKKGD